MFLPGEIIIIEYLPGFKTAGTTPFCTDVLVFISVHAVYVLNMIFIIKIHGCNLEGYAEKIILTHVMLNKLRSHAHF